MSVNCLPLSSFLLLLWAYKSDGSNPLCSWSVAWKEDDFTILDRIHLANAALRHEENAASRSCISANLFNLWIGQLSALVWWICSILMGFSLPEFGLTIYGNGAHTRYLRPPVDFFIERFLELVTSQYLFTLDRIWKSDFARELRLEFCLCQEGTLIQKQGSWSLSKPLHHNFV